MCYQINFKLSIITLLYCTSYDCQNTQLSNARHVMDKLLTAISHIKIHLFHKIGLLISFIKIIIYLCLRQIPNELFQMEKK